ncbi:MAG: tRNA (N(6)-L-threonylcarbamoyladenosine(37)-C(2))-methylthiotransferase MtaB [Ruminococcaceae bacterium]|nr:tRNA (N(6)-L-threonylcarbamoyladenosine(37)-C(2))-methylthiotransferase MtaB [Oscillospiraceae bacterium]
MKAAYATLGCKVNQYETVCIQNEMEALGFESVSFEEYADVYIINTCCVTAEGEKKSRNMIRRAKKKNPVASVAVCGCFSEKDGGKAALSCGADIVFGSADKGKIPEKLCQFIKNRQGYIFDKKVTQYPEIEPLTVKGGERTRATVKVEDGCNNFCSYCIIPYVRGRVRSKEPLAVINEIEGLVKKGYCEFVITGIHLASYGKESGKYELTSLIEQIAKTDGVERIRLGSLEPTYITEETAKRLSKIKELCPHFHLSMQSGCDKTLKEMNRKYTSERFYESVILLRKYFDNPAITTDILTGFPNESEEDFKEGAEFIKKVGFAQAHIFPYSIREGTVAAKLENQVPESEKAKRVKALSEITNKSREDFLKTQIGKEHKVLFEQRKGEFFEGYAENYVPVYVKCEKELTNIIALTKIEKLENGICYGKIVEF